MHFFVCIPYILLYHFCTLVYILLHTPRPSLSLVSAQCYKYGGHAQGRAGLRKIRFVLFVCLPHFSGKNI